MGTLKSQPQRSSWLSYAVLTVVLTGLFGVGLGLGSQASAGIGGDDKPSGSAIVNPPFQVQDFVLTNQAGTSTSLKDLRGRAVVLFFGYTHCPDVCPNTLAGLTQVKRLLGAESERAAFVFVTVDSQRDAPAVLKEYLDQFDPGFIGLTGDDAILSNLAAQYGAYFRPPASESKSDEHQHRHEETTASANYFVQHTSPAYLIDSQGFLRVVYFNGTAPDVIADGIRQILREAR
jgi:protein SCO1